MNLFCAIWWTFLFGIGIYESFNGIAPNMVIYVCALAVSAIHFWLEYTRGED